MCVCVYVSWGVGKRERKKEREERKKREREREKMCAHMVHGNQGRTPDTVLSCSLLYYFKSE